MKTTQLTLAALAALLATSVAIAAPAKFDLSLIHI